MVLVNAVKLIVGDVSSLPEGGEVREVLEFLEQNLSKILHEFAFVAAQDNSRVVMYAPFLARSFLEVGLTALAGRIDPFRLLSIRRIQKSPDYDRSVAWKAAMRWSGDVVSEAPSADPWTHKLDPQSMSRAVLGHFYNDLLWLPALQRLSDHSASLNGEGGQWLAEMIRRPPQAFCSTKRGTVNALYSELSKSVHFEGVVPLVTPDRVTVVNLVQKSVREVAELALVASFMEHPLSKLGADVALKLFNEFESMEVIS